MIVFTIRVPDCDITFETARGKYSAAAQSVDTDKSYADSEVSTLKPFILLNQCIDDHKELILPQMVKRRPLSLSLGDIGPGNSHPGLLQIKKR